MRRLSFAHTVLSCGVKNITLAVTESMFRDRAVHIRVYPLLINEKNSSRT